ncbi:hypothetical protein PB72LOC_03998 [Pectobacterium atrosepticum]|nr:hypothetical protein PB72LOC_03998 [Pectobacterium atrosepticum]
MTGIGSSDIACGIAGRHGRTHIAVRSQHRSRHIHAPGFTVGIHRGLVDLGADSNGHRITGFHFIADVTRHRNRLPGLTGVNHVIRGDIIDSNRRGGRHRIDTVSVSGVRRGGVACRIAGRHGRTHIAVRSQHRSRYVDAPGFTVGIHDGLVGLGAHGDRHRITGFHVVIDVTRHRNRLTRFAGINHVIGRDVIDSNRRGGRHRIDAVSVIRVGGGDVACGIACSDRGRDIAIGR